MLRFNKVASQRLRLSSSSSSCLQQRTFVSCSSLLQEQVSSSPSSSISIASGPSYQALASHEFSEKYKYNFEKAASEYSETLKEMNHRLRPLEIPARFRKLVFRPKNLTLLRTTTAFAIVDKSGNHLRDSEIIRGKPSSKILMKLIRRSATPATPATSATAGEETKEENSNNNIETVCEILDKCAKHYPDIVESKHISQLLISSARAGKLSSTMQFLFDKLLPYSLDSSLSEYYIYKTRNSDNNNNNEGEGEGENKITTKRPRILPAKPPLKNLLDLEVAREFLRLNSIKTVVLDRKKHGSKGLIKLYNKLHMQLITARERELKAATDFANSLKTNDTTSTSATPVSATPVPVTSSRSLEDDLQSHLLMIYGLAPLYKVAMTKKSVEEPSLEKSQQELIEFCRKTIGPHLSAISRLLIETKVPTSIKVDIELPKNKKSKKKNSDPTVITKIKPPRGLKNLYMDYVLGLQGLESIHESNPEIIEKKYQLNISKLKNELIPGVAELFSNNDLSQEQQQQDDIIVYKKNLPINAYIEQAAEGMLKEFKSSSSSSSTTTNENDDVVA